MDFKLTRETNTENPIEHDLWLDGGQLVLIGDPIGAMSDEFLPATRSRVSRASGSIRVAGLGSVPAGELVSVAGLPSFAFSTDAEVINAGALDAWFPMSFTCTQFGPIPALAGTLTNVLSADPDFLAATNSLDATLGRYAQTNADSYSEMVTQRVICRWFLFTGEWYLDQRLGTPWRETILGKAGVVAGEAKIERVLTAAAARAPGVRSVDSLTVTLDRRLRKLAVVSELTIDTGKKITIGELDSPFILEVPR